MARLPLIGGAYSARSIIANAQRAINLYPEPNRQDAGAPMTHYQRSGLRQLVAGISAPVRGLFRASNGNGYAVIGSNVYSISSSWGLTLLGTITPSRTNPVSMVDNGFEILLVDGSPQGWTITLSTNAFAQVTDTVFGGADRVDYLDSFLLWNQPGTRNFGSSLSNQFAPLDPLYFGTKTAWPDLLASLVVNRYEIVLFGTVKSEVWYNIGNPQFPFGRMPGSVIEHGLLAKYSIGTSDLSVFWLAQDLQGQALVFRLRGYEAKVISNYALANAIAKMAASGTISDAIGYCYQQNGHVFYVLTFPTGDQTWVFDDSISDPDLAWHQRAWTDSSNGLHRDRTNCCANINGLNVVGDWENGAIYHLDPDRYTDEVSGVLGPISFIRTFPHILAGRGPDAQPMLADGKQVKFESFIADIESGLGALNSDGTPAKLTLRYSDDRGRTFSGDVLQTSGSPGEYLTQPKWSGLGVARDRVFELEHSINGPAALNGAWVEATVLGQ